MNQLRHETGHEEGKQNSKIRMQNKKAACMLLLYIYI
jgi:hypothetical protein